MTNQRRLHNPHGRQHLPRDVGVRDRCRERGREATDEDAATTALARHLKVVFSSTLQEPLSWANTRLVRGDAVQAVGEMKESGSQPMRTLGSISLCRSLLEADLVDRFRVVIFPVLTGTTGRDLIYAEYPDVKLDLIDSRTFQGGLQLLEYVPAVPPVTRAS